MNPRIAVEKWFANLVSRSADNLTRTLNNEIASHLQGVPQELVRDVHRYAIFELLRRVNAPLALPESSDPHYPEFMEFITREYQAFFQSCARLEHWTPSTSARESCGDVPITRLLLFSKN